MTQAEQTLADINAHIKSMGENGARLVEYAYLDLRATLAKFQAHGQMALARLGAELAIEAEKEEAQHGKG